jgi:hypothetical protein
VCPLAEGGACPACREGKAVAPQPREEHVEGQEPAVTRRVLAEYRRLGIGGVADRRELWAIRAGLSSTVDRNPTPGRWLVRGHRHGRRFGPPTICLFS